MARSLTQRGANTTGECVAHCADNRRAGLAAYDRCYQRNRDDRAEDIKQSVAHCFTFP
jgi:hypothetical protein